MDLRLHPLDAARPGHGRHAAEDVRRAGAGARGRAPARRRDDPQARGARPPVRRRQSGARGAGGAGRRRAAAPVRALRRADRVARRQLRHRAGREHRRGGHGRDRRAGRRTSSAAASATAARAIPASTLLSASSTASARRSRHAFGTDDPAGRTVLVQGTGSVGAKLARLLLDAGAIVLVSDVNEQRARATGADASIPTPRSSWSATSMRRARSARRSTPTSIPRLRCRIVAGGANNQLATPEDGERLRAAGILYAPDYVINGGGALHGIGLESLGWDAERLEREVAGIGDTLSGIYRQADAPGSRRATLPNGWRPSDSHSRRNRGATALASASMRRWSLVLALAVVGGSRPARGRRRRRRRSPCLIPYLSGGAGVYVDEDGRPVTSEGAPRVPGIHVRPPVTRHRADAAAGTCRSRCPRRSPCPSRLPSLSRRHPLPPDRRRRRSRSRRPPPDGLSAGPELVAAVALPPVTSVFCRTDAAWPSSRSSRTPPATGAGAVP